jgi:2,3-diketo-5-methylthio-1-phosphopentane phosphatase
VLNAGYGGQAVPQAGNGARGTTPTEPVTVVTDFDGTITKRDTLDLVVERFGNPDVRRATEAELGRGLTLNQVIARQYGTLQASLDEVAGWLVEHSAFRPGFHRLALLAAQRGWALQIVSSGVEELIKPMLVREQLGHVPVISNSLAADPPPWRIAFRSEQRCEVCGQACKRLSVTEVAAGNKLVYIGDGFSDACAAEGADLVFARRRLATHLEARGREFQLFDDFFLVVEHLSESSVGTPE